MKHTLVSFIADIEEAKRPALEQALATLAADPVHNALLPFGQMNSVHFASFSIFANELGKTPDTLVLEMNGDGSVDALLGEVCAKGHKGLEAVFSCCQGYGHGPKTGDQLRAFLLGKLQNPAAWHIGNVGLSATRIRDEQRLRLFIEEHLDALRAGNRLPTQPDALREEIVRVVREEHPWALQSEPRQSRLEQIVPIWRLRAFVVALLGIFAWGWRVTLPGLGLFLALLRWQEGKDAREVPPPLEPRRQAAQEAAEFAQGQNHLSSLIRVRPGLLHRYLLRLVLFVVNLVARTSTQGELGGIPSIHFAHWSLVDGGKRLLFVSNYDNSWGSYLDDFTDKASGGLTAIWSNTRWFPPTRFLVKDGARAGALFKNWARLSQEPVRVWYRAYPELSVGNIERNNAIRQGLGRKLSGPALEAWLRLF